MGTAFLEKVEAASFWWHVVFGGNDAEYAAITAGFRRVVESRKLQATQIAGTADSTATAH